MLVKLLSLLRKLLIALRLLPFIKRILYSPSLSVATLSSSSGFLYRIRSLIEKANYHDCIKVDDVPAIHGYWYNKFIVPKLNSLGYLSEDDFYMKNILRRIDSHNCREIRGVSIGTGNCEFEVSIAQQLRDAGIASFSIECVDFNQAMLDRGQILAKQAGVLEHITPVQCDFNRWVPNCEYDFVIARWSLHHVVNLEGLFDRIKQAMKPTSVFLSSDMIGRNGHMRWPESLAIVNEYWKRMPDEYKYNPMLAKNTELYENFDCSRAGFEGIRAQDILPLLLERFHFDVFIGFSNIIEPFVDRAAGRNFDPSREWDRAFIDEVHRRDELEFVKGSVKPTQMFACMSNCNSGRAECIEPMTAQFSVRLQ